jgi:hypothetical protein
MRLTRAAQRAQEDEPTTDASDLKERSPLNEISSNASPDLVEREETDAKKTPARTKSKKGGKKGTKGKKAKAVEDEQAVEDEPEPAQVPVEDAAKSEVAEDVSEGTCSKRNCDIAVIDC